MKAKAIVGIALVVLLVLLLVQNTAVVTYRLLFWTISLSQVVLVPLIAILGFVIGYIAGSIRRRGKSA
jgi:uncharacterized integral membrane protein